MFHQLESKKMRVAQNCLVIMSNTPIIPSMIFRELSGLSRYIQNYYMESPTQMYLDIETSFNLQLKDQLPEWNDSLVEFILHQFTNQIIWDKTLNHAIYTKCYYARHLKDEEFLTHLAYFFEEGISLIHDLDTSKLFHNITYGAKRESLFFAPYCKGSLF